MPELSRLPLCIVGIETQQKHFVQTEIAMQLHLEGCKIFNMALNEYSLVKSLENHII